MEVIVQDNRVVIKTKYDPAVIEKIKQLPGRKWDTDKKVWILPARQLEALKKIFPDAYYRVFDNDPKLVNIEIHSDHASIFSSDSQVYNQVESICTFTVRNAKFSPKFEDGTWDGKICLYQKNSNRLPVGLIQKISSSLEKAGFVVCITDTRTYPKGESKPAKIQLRDYQTEAYEKWKEKKHTGIIAISPGLGKTEIAIQAIADLNVRTLFLVHTQDLAMQAIERLEKGLGVEVGFIGAGEFKLRKVNVGIIQTFHRSIKNPEMLKILEECELLVADEAHHYSATSFNAVMKKIHAPYRLGLTATPYREEGDSLIFESQLGEVVYSMTLKDGVKKGWLCNPQFSFHRAPAVDGRASDYTDDYMLNIVNNRVRNNMISMLACEKIKDGKSVLILINRLDHGEDLQTMIPSSVFLNGGLSRHVRAEKIAEFKQGKIKCVIATSIFDEGVDVPQIDVLINAVAQKSRGKYIQRIGRAMRINKGKEHCEIHDFIDKGIHTSRHSEMRTHTIHNEGFTIGEC